jgi:hypothetical protein|tara:strand:+ start:270 stop:380 length:111 start_codon:yes stop_codon:yes gene_type:complete
MKNKEKNNDQMARYIASRNRVLKEILKKIEISLDKR